MLRKNRTTRSGFTLVELMIAAAITVLIMTILSVCFQTSMKAMSSMRAQGDAADQLRALGTVMKRDFKADRHLPTESSTTVLNRGRRLSDYRFHQGALPPTTGFFQVICPPSTMEGMDGSFDSYRGTSALWFTSVLPGGDDSNLYTAPSVIMVSAVPTPVMFSSQAAEVSYFLLASGTTSGTPSMQMYNLYRRQRLVAIDSDAQSRFQQAVGVDPNVSEVISTFAVGGPPPGIAVNTMGDLAAGRRPPAGAVSPIPPLQSGGRIGDDIILSNVLSFEVKPTWESQGPTPGPRTMGNSTALPDTQDVFNALSNRFSSDAPFDTLSAFPLAGNQFDSTFPTGNHPRIRMNAMQIRVRVYDIKVKTARQFTIIVDL